MDCSTIATNMEKYVYDYSYNFRPFFQKETTKCDFLFVPSDKPFQTVVYSKGKEFAPTGANSFFHS